MEERELKALLAQTIDQKPYPVANVDGLAIAGAVAPSGKLTVVFMMVLDRTPKLAEDYPETPEEGMVIAAIGMSLAEVTELIAELALIPGVELPKTELDSKDDLPKRSVSRGPGDEGPGQAG